ncbi:Reverse transcriptase (RNA-dependent DNA polymerase) [Popillia japonica]|uniref:Reverse transcriptase (RNA-dependent DNA polymerase) n=1 Tax=Popillia japonica TaxID=7064 RepID=A0AAW1KN19_POPJA
MEIASSIKANCTGVEQGSVMGPILFLLYVMDLPSSIGDCRIYQFADDTSCILNGNALTYVMDLPSSIGDCRIYQFADDTSCILNGNALTTLSTTGNRISNNFNAWCQANSLVLNTSKTALLPFKMDLPDDFQL